VTAPVSAAAIRELMQARRQQKVSAQELADRMTSIGYPIKRSVIANVESGRRAEISLDHLAIACRALGIDPAAVLRRAAGFCPNCHGKPPTGFACLACSERGDAR